MSNKVSIKFKWEKKTDNTSHRAFYILGTQ